MLNIAVLVSGGATCRPCWTAKPGARTPTEDQTGGGLQARRLCAGAGRQGWRGGVIVRRKDYAASEDFDAALLAVLKEHDIDLVVLAGFLSVLGPSVIAAYPRRI